uniref:D-alanyl-D-alanine carboxypeptidase family protein n=1 Tax=Thomasclavelia cocleata TaxID=69824 RepID=UPI00272EC4B5
GKVLYEHNIHEKLRPASVTKVMTILLIMEALDSGRISLDDKVPCSENATKMGGSQIWLDTRESLTVHEMLKAICVVSANDCTVAMAEFLAGSTEAFVTQMNVRARELGMNDTTFKNCHGIDEDGHLTSAYDISLMSRELLTKHPKITEYTTIWMDSLRDR